MILFCNVRRKNRDFLHVIVDPKISWYNSGKFYRRGTEQGLVRYYPRCVRSTCKQSQVKAKSAVHKMHFLTGWKTHSEHRYNIIIQHTFNHCLTNRRIQQPLPYCCQHPYHFHSQHMTTFTYNYGIKRNNDKLLILFEILRLLFV